MIDIIIIIGYVVLSWLVQVVTNQLMIHVTSCQHFDYNAVVFIRA